MDLDVVGLIDTVRLAEWMLVLELLHGIGSFVLATLPFLVLAMAAAFAWHRWRRAKLLLSLILMSGAGAQVTVRYSPEPMAVPTAVLANARNMGRWLVMPCNDLAAPAVTLSWERVAMAAGDIAFIDPDDALLVLTAHVRSSPASRAVLILSYAARGAAIGLAVASKSNVSWSTGIGVGAGVLPDVIDLIRGGVPSAVPLVSTVRWPLVLGPGQCAKDHWFAAKMRRPKPYTAVIR